MTFKKNRSISSIILTIVIILLNLSLESCYEIKNIPGSKIDSLNKGNYIRLNGQYSNHALKSDTISWIDQRGATYQPKSFWNLTYSYLREKPFADINGQTVRLRFKTKRKLSLTLYQRDTLITTRVIRGNIKNGYFYAKPQLVVTPFIPLVFGYSGFRYRIGIHDSTLLVDYRWKYWGFAILAGGSGRGQTHSGFKEK
jgi:hypothetical protein